jgi:hypothetical protein
VLGDRADGDHGVVARRVRDAAERPVAGGGHDHDVVTARVAQGGEHVRDLGRAELAIAVVELEREVDHVGAVADREPDPRRDGHAVARSVGVEHPDRHDARAVREAGDAEVVAGALADRARHVRAVAVLVVREAVVVHEVVAADEVAAPEVGRPAEPLAVGVGDAGVQHRDGRSTPARVADAVQVVPRHRCVDAGAGEEVPLQVLPAAGGVGDPGVVRDVARQPRDLVRRRGGDLGPRPQLANGLRHALTVADLQHARVWGERLRGADAGRALDLRPLAAADPPPVAHDDLAGDVGRAGLGGGGWAGRGTGRCGERSEQCGDGERDGCAEGGQGSGVTGRREHGLSGGGGPP